MGIFFQFSTLRNKLPKEREVTQLYLTLWTPWTVACLAPSSMGFSKQEYWSGLPCPSPEDLPDPGIKPGSPTLQADSLPYEPAVLSQYWPKISSGFPVQCYQNLNELFGQANGGVSGIEPTCQCRRHKRRRFCCSARKILWRRKWQPAPLFLPGKFHRQRSLVGYSPWDSKKWDKTERTHTVWNCGIVELSNELETRQHAWYCERQKIKK